MERRKKIGALVRIVFAILGIISGISIFVSFIAFKNVNAAIWGLLSAVFAALNLRLHVAYRKDKMPDVYPLRTLRHLKQFGVFGTFAAIVAAVTYFILAVVLKQGYKAEDDGYMPAGIFALLTLKWTAFLFCYGKRYEELYSPDGDTKPIANREYTENTKGAII